MYIEHEGWREAANVASTLCDPELTLADVPAAVHDAEQSVVFADRSSDAGWRTFSRPRLANVLHCTGRRADALASFREAEEMQVEHQPGYPLLYSLAGFLYCDLLLASAERAAWQIESVAVSTTVGGSAGRPSGLAEICSAVTQRASQTLEWATPHEGLLDIALDHLTLGRAGLYRAILERLDASGVLAESAIENPKFEIEQAVDGLRRAGTIHHLPRGLLTRAWLRSLTADADGARSDLDEAWEIAERGPMPLFQADVHLHRARLFRDKDALVEARRLIEKHGYGRRLEELADAEEASKDW